MADRSLARFNADLATRAQLAAGLDARLALINPSENVDKYYVLQGLEDTDLQGDERYFSFQHWGRTGAAGDGKLEGPSTLEDVKARLHKVFKEKSGAEWGSIQPGDRVADGKYWLQQIAKPDAKAKWEYYVGDGVDGKRPGWYPYTEDASDGVESLHAQHAANNAEERTSTRIVESGHFSYKVDLEALTQTNTRTNKVREIRRVMGSGEGSQPAPGSRRTPVKKAMKARPPPPMRSASTASLARSKSMKTLARTKSMKAMPRTAMKKSPPMRSASTASLARSKSMKKLSAMKSSMKTVMKTAMKKAMKKKAMKKAMKKKPPMKKAMKRKSTIAKGKHAKVAVWRGAKAKTLRGVKKSDLKKSTSGRIVTKKQSAVGHKAFKNIATWVSACKMARKELGITGFLAIKKGTPLYEKAKELRATAAPHVPARSASTASLK